MEIKANPKNPRIIKDENFKRLVQSIKDFPKMMELRPIVYDPVTGYILGGNMRFRAAQQAGYKKLPDTWVRAADTLTEEEKDRFIITDNVAGGEWNWEQLSAEWDADLLKEWGVELPKWADGLDVNNMTDEDVDLNEKFDPIGLSAGLTRLVVIFDSIASADNWIKDNSLTIEYKKKGNNENIILQCNLSSNYGI